MLLCGFHNDWEGITCKLVLLVLDVQFIDIFQYIPMDGLQ